MPPAGEITAALGRAKVSPAAGAAVEIDISKIGPGEMQIFEWRGKPVWVIRRRKNWVDEEATAHRGRDE
jgi:ubiquinol-cytochrome c reductase iron-sulfur subunit